MTDTLNNTVSNNFIAALSYNGSGLNTMGRGSILN
jgi:hypothetical protein